MELQVGETWVQVNIRSRTELLDRIGACFDAHRGFALATLNLDHLVKLRTNPDFREAYARQDFVTADGNPIAWLARLARRPVELLPGSDLIRPVLRLAALKGVPVGLLGSTDDSLAAAATALEAEIPGLDVRARVAPPMGFDPASPEAGRILDDLAAQGIGLVLLALGAPKQERLAALGRVRQPALGFLSIGAGLDFIAGSQRRAPLWVRRLALEWLWRMALSPRRLFRRYLACALILPGHLGRALAQQRGKAAMSPARSSAPDSSGAPARLPEPSSPASAEGPRSRSRPQDSALPEAQLISATAHPGPAREGP